MCVVHVYDCSDRTVRVWQELNGADSADGGGTSPSAAAAAAARLD